MTVSNPFPNFRQLESIGAEYFYAILLPHPHLAFS
jgi:hypothetical protein